MIEFNPYFRYSAHECLFDSSFDDIRDKNAYIKSNAKFILNIDKEDTFDYTNNTSLSFDTELLMQAIKEEVRCIRSNRDIDIQAFLSN